MPPSKGWVAENMASQRGREDEFYDFVWSYLANTVIAEAEMRRQVASHPMPRLVASAAPSAPPATMSSFFRRGMIFVTLLLALSAASLAVVPAAGVAGAGLCLAAWGGVVIIDTAKNGRSIQDPRFGVLVLLAGISTLAVLLTRFLVS
jgi:hypothetical protein